MKKLVLLLPFLLSVFFSRELQAQGKQEALKSIRAELQRINTDSTLRIVKLENDDFVPHTDNGSSLTGYYDKNGSLRKMVSRVGISIGAYVDEYYFRDGELMFALSTLRTYARDSKGNINHKKPTVPVYEGRYYFSSGKLIQQLVSDKEDIMEPQLKNTPEVVLKRRAALYRQLLEGEHSSRNFLE